MCALVGPIKNLRSSMHGTTVKIEFTMLKSCLQQFGQADEWVVGPKNGHNEEDITRQAMLRMG
jgi:hypothetical protein